MIKDIIICPKSGKKLQFGYIHLMLVNSLHDTRWEIGESGDKKTRWKQN
jgi:hypothetical protein